MKRRIYIVALVLMMALSAIPVTASAKAEDAQAQLYNRTRKSYTSSLASYGKSSFHGYCATLVAYQLRYNGITKSAELCNGNEMYDRYKNKERSSGGYYIHAYSAKDYNLEQTLNVISRNGTKDVYNILVGFQWTNTAAGSRYGHTVFINGILDGIVYFTESFDSATIGDEGTVGQLTIAQFAKMYGSWTRYEGCIYFTRDYAESLESWQTDLIVRARFSAQLRSQPCLVGQENCQLLRSVYAGERLLVTGVVCNREGQWYYAVQDGDYTGYIVAQATAVEQMGTDFMGVRDLEMTQNIAPEETLRLSGTAYCALSDIGQLDVVVTDETGLEAARLTKTVEKRTYALEQLELPILTAGEYQLTVQAEVEIPYIVEDRLETEAVTALVLDMPVWVGPMARTALLETAVSAVQMPDGWSCRDGIWYYYENGQPHTGWLWEHGVRYYLDETGAAATGWTVVDGQTCLFSATGALCTGWIRDVDGMRYCSYEGRFANEFQRIDGVLYYFQEGLLQSSGIVTDGMEVYKIQPDGQAILLTEE